MDMAHNDPSRASANTPLDIRIVSWYFYLCAVGMALAASGYVVGAVRAARLGPTPSPTRLFLGTFTLSGCASLAVYYFATAGVTFVFAWGIGRRRRFAWWFSLVYLTYFMLEMAFLLMGQVRRSHGLASLVVYAALLVWFYLRRHLFGVGPRGRRINTSATSGTT